MSGCEIFSFPVVVANSRHRLTSKKVSSSSESSGSDKSEAVRSQVDSKPPAAQTHHYFQATKIQVYQLPCASGVGAAVTGHLQDAQKRIGLIERENKSISARLADIYRGGCMVDCWNPYSKKSVNREKQNIELVRITVENQGILKRIRDRKPTIDRKQCEKDWLASAPFTILLKKQL
ncbi:sperm axonemal maintenance protein CFAP97D1 [Tiliqua scincoides]|uniref:sperm axonemal maintenance protein CFAP97D1 n=1 Tax=Tiliqua scincoides TaxID=71010 RepID=UPI003461FFE3